MRNSRTRIAVAAGIGAASLVAATARADLTTVVAEDDLFALDGVTRLVDVPGYAGERVVNVYALFDNPDDQLVGVLGRPFDVVTGGGTTFINEPTFGDDRAPEQALVMAVPALNWDSFVTIGNKFDSPTSQLLLAPKFVGPNTSPWTMPSGWIAPPSVGSSGGFNEQNLIDVLFFWGTPDPMGDLNGDGLVDSADLTAALTGWGSGGVPAAQTVAGPMQRVLIARIVVAPGETVNFDMTVIGGDDGNFQANIVSFSTSNPACGPDAGPCNMGNGSPGCNDPACCELVCSLLPNCCDIDWNHGCAGEAINQGCAHGPCCMDVGEILTCRPAATSRSSSSLNSPASSRSSTASPRPARSAPAPWSSAFRASRSTARPASRPPRICPPASTASSCSPPARATSHVTRPATAM
jgi:hypothetical protein